MWSNGSTRLALTAVACALLIACSGGDSPPAPTPAPVGETPTAVSTTTAPAEPTPSATAAVPSPTGTATSAPTATAPAHWQPTFREVPTEEVFVTRTYAPGEDFSDQAGLFFLDTETGEVEMWSLPAAGGTEEEYRAVDIRASWTNRYVYAPAVSALHDRQTGVTVTWSADDFVLIAGERGIGMGLGAIERWSRSFGPLGWGVGEDAVLVAAVREGRGRGVDARIGFAVLNTDLEAVASFSVPELMWLDRNRLDLWASPDGKRLLVQVYRTLYIVDLASSSHVPINVHPSSPNSSEFPRVHLHESGFAVTGDCRITHYDWAGVELSTTEVAQGGCHFPMLSPDGKFLAVGTILVRVAWPALSALMGLVMYDAVTGEALFHARGIAEPPSMQSATPWLPDSSALYVMSGKPRSLRLLGANGEWLPLAPELAQARGLVPAPGGAALFSANLTSVIDAEGRVVAGTVIRSSPSHWAAPQSLSPWSPWGKNSDEMRFQLPLEIWASDPFTRSPVQPPLLASDPFDDRAMEVHAAPAGGARLITTYNPHVGKRAPEPIPSDEDRWLANGSLVEITESESEWGTSDVLTLAECQEPAETGCLWAFVRTADGTEGWVQIDYLRWVVAEP